MHKVVWTDCLSDSGGNKTAVGRQGQAVSSQGLGEAYRYLDLHLLQNSNVTSAKYIDGLASLCM